MRENKVNINWDDMANAKIHLNYWKIRLFWFITFRNLKKIKENMRN